MVKKLVAKKPAKFVHMTQVEIDQAKRWTTEEGLTPHAIAKRLKRDPPTVRRHLVPTKKGRASKPKGRPPMSPADYAKCNKALVRMQKAVKAKNEITVSMVIEKAGVDYCEKTVRKYFRKDGKPFRKLREKPLLTPDDVKSRKRFTTKHYKKPKASWSKTPKAIIDNKRFPMYLDLKGRQYAARRSCRGAYRSGKDAVQDHLVKPKATLKFPAQGVIVAAGVIKNRIRMWHVIEGRWTATKAAEMYGGPLLKSLKKAYPGSKKFEVLEDNDPAGYKSHAAQAKKKEVGIEVMELPPRSPDLNVLDYCLWAEISRRLRNQEAAFPANKKESKEQFLARLRRTALGLPTALVKRAVQDMKRRCTLIKEAKGYLIDED